MSDIKKFTSNCEVDMVNKKDLIQTGDWLLKWSPSAASSSETGFALFTPGGFDPGQGGNPLGGLVLAAIFFLLEHGDNSFPRELIARANELSKEIENNEKQEGSMISSSGRT